MPLKRQSGLLALEDENGHQSWALITDAMVEYGSDVEFATSAPPEMKVIATLPPGELLRQAGTFEADEENVLMYSRLLVAVLREERDRYAELERKFLQAQRERAEAIEQLGADKHYAWQDGAVQGLLGSLQWRTRDEILQRNPHPAPDEGDEEF